METKGANLSSRLNSVISAMENDDLSRSDIIARMATAAGISAETVNEILNNNINCPPLRRLRGFARVLDVSFDALQSVAESDGCEYGADERSFCPITFEQKGMNLASLLNSAIDEMVDDSTTRSDIMTRMGSAGGISESTVEQILSESINCPPLPRLRGFSRVLGLSVERIITAAESDGCEYDEDGKALKCILNPNEKSAGILIDSAIGSIDSSLNKIMDNLIDEK